MQTPWEATNRVISLSLSPLRLELPRARSLICKESGCRLSTKQLSNTDQNIHFQIICILVSSFSFQYLTIKPNYAELCIPVTMPFFTVYGQKKSSINQWVNDTWSVWTSLARNDWLNWFPQVLLEYCLTDIFITWPKGNNSQYGIWKMLHAKLICYCCRINKKEDITLLVKIGEQSRVIFQGIVSFVRSATRCHLIPELFGLKAKKPATRKDLSWASSC